MAEVVYPPGVRGTSSAVLTVYTGTDQAANTEFSETVPAGEQWQLLSVTVSLAQGATQTPQPALVIDDGTTILYLGYGSSAAMSASTTCRYTWAPGLTLTGQIGSSTTVRSNAPLPANLILSAGFRIRSITSGIGANSDYAAPAFYIVKYKVPS